MLGVFVPLDKKHYIMFINVGMEVIELIVYIWKPFEFGSRPESVPA